MTYLETIVGFLKDEADLNALFAPDIAYNSPAYGLTKGRTPAKWDLTELKRELNLVAESVEIVASYQSGNREAIELLFTLIDYEDYAQLPMAMIGEIDSDDLIADLKLYYSPKPYGRRVPTRTALYTPTTRNAKSAPGYVSAYRKALAAGKLDSMLELFHEDAVCQDASGNRYGVGYPMALAEFFGFAFSVGKIEVNFPVLSRFELESSENSIEVTAAEYTCSVWGNPITPQAGIEFFEVDGDGLITALRLYDDIDPAAGKATSKQLLGIDNEFATIQNSDLDAIAAEMDNQYRSKGVWQTESKISDTGIEYI